MKVQLETVTSKINRSFSLMFNPRLSDLFFWHSHPEYELVFISGADGTRHVGDHISNFSGSDLVLIGSDIPHLNFDYGVKTDYQKVVVHLKKEFVEEHFKHAAELSPIQRLFELSSRGVAFLGDEKHRIGERLFELESLPPFEQYLHLIRTLQMLANLENKELLHEKAFHRKVRNNEQHRLRLVHSFIDQNYQRKIEVNEIADLCSMTKEAFCRYFKKKTTYTFVEFLNRYRVTHSKRYLMAGQTVSDACYHSGFQSLSYFNRIFKRITNENPSGFRNRYAS